MATYRLIGTWWPSLSIVGNEWPADQGIGIPLQAVGWSPTTMAVYQNFTKSADIRVHGTYEFDAAAVPGFDYAPFGVGWDTTIPAAFRTLATTVEEVLEGLIGPASIVIDTTIPMMPMGGGPFDLYNTPPAGELQGVRDNFQVNVFIVLGTSLDEFGAPQEPYILYMPDGVTYSMIAACSIGLSWDETRNLDDGMGTQIVGQRTKSLGSVTHGVLFEDDSASTADLYGTYTANGVTGAPVSPGWGFTMNLRNDDQFGPYGDVSHTHATASDVELSVTEWLTPPVPIE